jgi:DNA processing protein
MLRDIPDAPPGLWYRGDPKALRSSRSVAVVGSRAGSRVALETADQLARSLASRHVAVISGLARGVDSAAHRGALAAGGLTVAVLGSGLRQVYPAEHRPLAEEIERSGAVISEYPPDTPALPFHFPMRNRIISALSQAVVVIEASEQSGSLITAACALEQGKDVMAVPGNVLSGRNRGGHALIRDGAKIVESADDILLELGWSSIADVRANGRPSVTESGVSNDLLLGKMEAGVAYELDELAVLCGLGAAELLPHLTTLEVSGLVYRREAGRFVRAS